MARIRADGGADVQHDAFAAHRRPDRGDGRTVDLRHGAQAELRHGHQRAGIAGGDRNVGLALLHRFERAPHGRLLPPLPQGLARLFIHADRDFGVVKRRNRLERGMLIQQRKALGLLPMNHEGAVRMALQRDCGSRDDDGGTEVATHGVQGYSHLASHGGSTTAFWAQRRCADSLPPRWTADNS